MSHTRATFSPSTLSRIDFPNETMSPSTLSHITCSRTHNCHPHNCHTHSCYTYTHATLSHRSLTHTTLLPTTLSHITLFGRMPVVFWPEANLSFCGRKMHGFLDISFFLVRQPLPRFSFKPQQSAKGCFSMPRLSSSPAAKPCVPVFFNRSSWPFSDFHRFPPPTTYP